MNKISPLDRGNFLRLWKCCRNFINLLLPRSCAFLAAGVATRDYNFGKRRFKVTRARRRSPWIQVRGKTQGNSPGIASSSSVTRFPREIQHREQLWSTRSCFRGSSVLRDSSLVTLECNPRIVIEILTRSVLLEEETFKESIILTPPEEKSGKERGVI